MCLLHLCNQSIDREEEILSVGVRTAENKFVRMRRQPLMMCDTCPASDVTVAEQSQSPDITNPPCMPKVGEHVFQGQFQSLVGVHVAGVMNR